VFLSLRLYQLRSLANQSGRYTEGIRLPAPETHSAAETRYPSPLEPDTQIPSPLIQ